MSETGDVRADITRWRNATRAPGDGGQRRLILVAASFTANAIDAGLGLGLLDRRGDVVEIDHHDYNQIFQLCLAPGDHVSDDVDDVIVLWRIEDVFERDFHRWCDGDADAFGALATGAESLGRAVASCRGAIEGAMLASDAPVPIGFGLDHHDPAELASLSDLARHINDAFDRGLGDASGVERLHLAALQHAAGTVGSFDRRNWLMYRQPFPTPFAHLVGRSIADVDRRPHQIGAEGAGPGLRQHDLGRDRRRRRDRGAPGGRRVPRLRLPVVPVGGPAAAPPRRAVGAREQERPGDSRAGVRRSGRHGPDRRRHRRAPHLLGTEAGGHRRTRERVPPRSRLVRVRRRQPLRGRLRERTAPRRSHADRPRGHRGAPRPPRRVRVVPGHPCDRRRPRTHREDPGGERPRTGGHGDDARRVPGVARADRPADRGRPVGV